MGGFNPTPLATPQIIIVIIRHLSYNLRRRFHRSFSNFGFLAGLTPNYSSPSLQTASPNP